MTTLTFYGGVGEIGGNKILLTDDESRVFLDFGMNFEKLSKTVAVATILKSLFRSAA